MKLKQLYIKLTSWEYWPMWVLYVPVFLQHYWLSIKAKSLFYFLKVNPAIGEGFILSDTKYTTLQLVPETYRPKTVLIAKGSTLKALKATLQDNNLHFPIIVKPNIGFRGLLVHLCKNEEDLRGIHFNKADYIVQEYIAYPVEVGIFYYRFPNKTSGQIPSITLKEFLTVTGNGTHTLEELIKEKPRALLQYKKLEKKFKHKWHYVVPEGKTIKLETIGNHNRGTKFINGNAILDNQLLKVFDDLNGQMPGFFYGRFDIRAKSINDLKQGKNFKILEVNGIGAEPTHIYDPSYKLFNAWKEMLHLWKVAYQIAMLNKEKGEKFPVFSEAKKRYLQYKNYKKIAFTH
ncbi:D-alanine--D-alanine ligase [Galbibacter pacificus]|uniref:D-alanine--D-alanine ligase n=1 Tax=Galbibacter pacificus TaxID=2996052 RepID=A0ABT6FUH5_9FLAO|nr:D-alanine--D-alanine ligase [Galbibacter pacificus]MDG3583614.1 D-alanine--D-alanine ligase [Galbibacter pacificus]MDG3586910.1 D-alanine--D-alanine ligase [Galbibacter pacificus]